MRQHLARILKFQQGARDLLEEHQFVAARTVAGLAAAFSARFRREVVAG